MSWSTSAHPSPCFLGTPAARPFLPPAVRFPPTSGYALCPSGERPESDHHHVPTRSEPSLTSVCASCMRDISPLPGEGEGQIQTWGQMMDNPTFSAYIREFPAYPPHIREIPAYPRHTRKFPAYPHHTREIPAYPPHTREFPAYPPHTRELPAYPAHSRDNPIYHPRRRVEPWIKYRVSEGMKNLIEPEIQKVSKVGEDMEEVAGEDRDRQLKEDDGDPLVMTRPKLAFRYSHKIFIGGTGFLPLPIIVTAFRRFGKCQIDPPYYSTRGFCFLVFEHDSSVEKLMKSCWEKGGHYHFNVIKRTHPSKAWQRVEVRPWKLDDNVFISPDHAPKDICSNANSVLIMPIPKMITAKEVGAVAESKFGSVSCVKLRTEKLTGYPTGVAKIMFKSAAAKQRAIASPLLLFTIPTPKARLADDSDSTSDDEGDDEKEGVDGKMGRGTIIGGTKALYGSYTEYCRVVAPEAIS